MPRELWKIKRDPDNRRSELDDEKVATEPTVIFAYGTDIQEGTTDDAQRQLNREKHMKFNLPQPAPKQHIDTTLRLGNVYSCKGGNKTHYWIVVGFDERVVNLLGVNSDGVVTSTANYGTHVFDARNTGYGRELLGRCDGIETMEFDVTWYVTGRTSDA
jgi:hypothetical protein